MADYFYSLEFLLWKRKRLFGYRTWSRDDEDTFLRELQEENNH